MAAHYDTAILPARPRKPRDKAKVEAGVLIVERWLLGRLRNRRFYSLAEVNEAIRDLLVRLNEQRPIRRLGVTRRQLHDELDRPALKPLPLEPYVFAGATGGSDSTITSTSTAITTAFPIGLPESRSRCG